MTIRTSSRNAASGRCKKPLAPHSTCASRSTSLRPDVGAGSVLTNPVHCPHSSTSMRSMRVRRSWLTISCSALPTQSPGDGAAARRNNPGEAERAAEADS